MSGHQVQASEEFKSDENVSIWRDYTSLADVQLIHFSSLQTLIYRDGNLSSATLEALIQHMVPTNDYYPDRSYIFAFLLSSRLFIKPYQLLSKLWDLSQQQQNLKSFIQVSAAVKYLSSLSKQKKSQFFNSFLTAKACAKQPEAKSILTIFNSIVSRMG